MSRCGIVILAAGGSTRMGRPKQLLPLNGTSLLRRAVQTALASGCRPVVVVLGAGADAMKHELAHLAVSVVINEKWKSGIGSSIRAGVAAVAAQTNVDAVAVCLCDQPYVSAEVIDRLVHRREVSGKRICAAAYDGTVGTPAVFAASLFGELLALEDRQGGKALIQRHADDVQTVDAPEGQIDIDTEAEYREIVSRTESP